jgi:hypothetical protein
VNHVAGGELAEIVEVKVSETSMPFPRIVVAVPCIPHGLRATQSRSQDVQTISTLFYLYQQAAWTIIYGEEGVLDPNLATVLVKLWETHNVAAKTWDEVDARQQPP